MAIVTSVLTGGINNHETTSEEANGIATDFVSEGIVGSVANTSGVAPATGGFAVNAQGTPDMTVAVSAGVAYVTGTPSSQNSQTFRIKNSASENVTISANSSGSTKYDWLYVKLDATKLNAPNTAGDDAATLVTSRSSSAASDDGTPPTYGYPIAVITVANGATTITNGNIRDIRNQVSLNTGSSNAVDGWVSLSGSTTFSTVSGYNKGNREYELTSSADLTGVLSPGMRLKVTRGVTPPTQCTDLESSSSQYWSKSSPSGITFTDDFTFEAWVKLESYGSVRTIVARRNASTDGFQFRISALGNVSIFLQRIAANNVLVESYQSIPLGRWVHVASSHDLSGASHKIYIDGVDVPVETTITGTITAIVQQASTPLVLGAYATGSESMDGMLTDVRIWSAVRTATQIRDNMNQQLVGSETNLVAYFKLNGDGNDSTSNANNLSAQNGATATTSDNPMKSTEYAIITKVATSTVTVFTGTDYNIPNITLSTPHYSTQKAPFGFSCAQNKWVVESILRRQTATSSNANYGSLISNGWALFLPIGEWSLGYDAGLFNNATTTVAFSLSPTSLSGVTLGNEDVRFSTKVEGTGSGNMRNNVRAEDGVSNTADATYVMYSQGATTSAGIDGDNTHSVIFAECAYA